MNAIQQKACLRAQEIRNSLGIRIPSSGSTYVKPETKRTFRCVEGAMFKLNESTGKYHPYDYMENTPGVLLKK